MAERPGIPEPAPAWVALDAMGVLYAERGVAAQLAAFAARRGVTLGESATRAAYRRASAGEHDSAGLWRALGVPGDAGELDAAFVAQRSLTPGVGDFLAARVAAGLPTGCITNDVAAWSRRTQALLGLGGVEPWIVSAEVACRKPGRAIYDAFLAAAGCEPDACLFVDDTPQNLDAAAALGFRTAWFSAGEVSARGPGGGTRHGRVGSFEELAQVSAPLLSSR